MITIATLSHDGRGVGRVDGKAVFVAGALPDETVSVSYYKRHKNFDEAVVNAVLDNASPNRVVARCPHFLVCGGCSLQHLDPAAQHQHKQAVLVEQFAHFGHITVTPEMLLPPLFDHNPWGYRYRARLSVRYDEKKQKTFIGFRERLNSRFITDMSSCDILVPAVGTRIEAFKQLVDSLDGKKTIPQLEVAATDDQCVLIFRHMEPLSEQDVEKLRAFGQENNLSMVAQPNNMDNLHWLHPEKEQPLFYHLKNPPYTPLCKGGEADVKLFFKPAHFTQVNPVMNQKMVSQAMALLDPQSDETVLDLFCGLGNFSLPLAKRAKQVIGVEGSDLMVKQAEHNAKVNQINNTHFYAADLTKLIFLSSQWGMQTYDKVLLDPPRTGALEIVYNIEKWQPKTILYVSCNPATLARDAEILVHKKGYKVTKVGIIDMFPHTTHVESMALFERV